MSSDWYYTKVWKTNNEIASKSLIKRNGVGLVTAVFCFKIMMPFKKNVWNLFAMPFYYPMISWYLFLKQKQWRPRLCLNSVHFVVSRYTNSPRFLLSETHWCKVALLHLSWNPMIFEFRVKPSFYSKKLILFCIFFKVSSFC